MIDHTDIEEHLQVSLRLKKKQKGGASNINLIALKDNIFYVKIWYVWTGIKWFEHKPPCLSG